MMERVIVQKSYRLTILQLLALCLVVSSLTAFISNLYYIRNQFRLLEVFCEELIKTQPETEKTVLEILKNKDIAARTGEQNILIGFGYHPSDFSRNSGTIFVIAGIGFLAGGILFFTALWYCDRMSAYRIRKLADYLEKINTGSPGVLWEASEDEFSKLQDEIYKTVTALYQTRDTALKARNKFADNLSNIAHQLKTPITAISLSVQMMNNNLSSEYLPQIDKQLKRLTHLEEALLFLSRIDAGALTLKRSPVDVYTLLMLAADNLQELFKQAEVLADIPEMGEVTVCADLDWTLEALLNLMKNCMEHCPAGKAMHCSYEKNPLYTQIRIWDEGAGFEKEDLPHLFERFYRGKTAKEGSIGIGLSLAKEIIEMQNGLLSANNLPAGGACFEIRFYSH